MLSPAEVGWDLTLYAQEWLEERFRLTLKLAADVKSKPSPRIVHDLRVACRRLREAIEKLAVEGILKEAGVKKLRFNNRPIVEQSLGELLIRALLRSRHAPNYTAETASAWRGDQLFSFQNDALLNIFWFSSWHDETSAGEFLESYRKVLESRQGVRFETLRQPNFHTLIATQRDGRAWLLQARGPNVLALQAASADRLTELGEEAWRDLEIEAETSAVRFESARRPVNFH